MAIGLLAILCFGCGPNLYVPNTINAPLFERKGDYKASIAYRASILNYQGGYAVDDNWAIVANAVSPFSLNPNKKQYFIEAGGGYFTAFGESKCGIKPYRAEMLTGYGIGIGNNGWGGGSLLGLEPKHYYAGEYSRFFLQPSLGYKGKVFVASFSTRVSFVHFNDYNHYENGILADREGDNARFSTIEPVVTVSVGFNNAKAFIQLGALGLVGGYSSDYYKVVTNDLEFGAIIPRMSCGWTFSPWNGQCPPEPVVSLEPIKQQPTDTVAEPVEMAKDSVATVFNLTKSQATICLSDASAPDGDIVSVSFNGRFVVKEAELFKSPVCFDVDLLEGNGNIMLVHGIFDGKFKPNTVRVVVKEGRKERTFNINTEEGKSVEIRFRLN